KLGEATGGAVVGAPNSTTVTIRGDATPSGPTGPGVHTSGPGPIVQDMRLILGNGGVRGIVLSFNEPIDPARAVNLASYGYLVAFAGPDGIFRTPDDLAVLITSAVYDPAPFRVQLTLATPLPL